MKMKCSARASRRSFLSAPLRRRMEQLQLHPIRTLWVTSAALKILTTFLLYSTHYLPSFDTSSTLLLASSPQLEPFIRWDTVYFLRVAMRGYEHEQQAAFMPGLPGVMRGGGEVLRWCRGAIEVQEGDAVLVGMLASMLAGMGAVVCLYRCALRLPSLLARSLTPPLPREQAHPPPNPLPSLLPPHLPPIPPPPLPFNIPQHPLHRTLLRMLHSARHAPPLARAATRRAGRIELGRG